MFSSAPRVFTSRIRLSATENLASTQTHPTPSQYITTLPQRPHSTLLLSKGYPSAPEPNSSRVLRERSARLHGASPEKAPASPHTAKKMLQNIEGAAAEGFLLTPDRYCRGSELRLPDSLGDGGGQYYSEGAVLHHVLLLWDTEYSSGAHLHYNTEVISFFKPC